MRGKLLILSGDLIFARMLALEAAWMGLSAQTLDAWDAREADVILWDLDSVRLPADLAHTHGQIIGFTKLFEVSKLDPDRRCSMILHRPFEMRLLREEITALLDGSRAPAPQSQKPMLALHGLVLTCGGEQVTLSPKEALVMECLLKKSPLPVSRETLTDVIGASTSNKADVYVCYLRRKLEAVCNKPLIRTVRGKGYRLDEL